LNQLRRDSPIAGTHTVPSTTANVQLACDLWKLRTRCNGITVFGDHLSALIWLRSVINSSVMPSAE